MTYQVLARKWRPKNFQDMVGQEPTLRMLTNALEQKRLHHAYLFTGTRGVGKTTLARILAKCLNCESGITPIPCGQCFSCHAIDSGQFLDLFEIDAASRTKVEDTRELLDNVLYPPTQGRFKVYLIDEVHMLSNHSFNALLKTLEEPPEHVKFLLATTEHKKLPVTILSRCLQFHLTRISKEQIAKQLQRVCDSESINYETLALEKLAKAAEGSMRDALSLLDQAITYSNGNVKHSDMDVMLGCLSQDDLFPLLDALITQNGSELFKRMGLLSERAPDFQQLLDELINLFHNLAIIQILPNALEAEEFLIKLSQALTPEDVQLYYQIALLGKRDLSLASSYQQGFEMTMLRMLAFKPSLDKTEKVDCSPRAPANQDHVKPSINQTIIEKKIESATEPATIENLPQWRDLLPKLELSGMAYALAANCTLEAMSQNIVTLTLSASHQPMLNSKLKERIAEALSRYFKQTIELKINTTTAPLVTPVKQQQSEQTQQLTDAKQTFMQNPQIKSLLEMYDATLEVSLV